MMAKNKKQKPKSKLKLDPDIMIMELTESYPEVVDFLVREYDFHCIGCIMAGFETLRQGAQAHGIIGQDYDEMIQRLEDLINK